MSTVDAQSITVSVPAKINLELRVGPLRGDGYHDLATLFHALDLVDRVTVQPAGEWRMTVDGVDAHLVPTDESNLALKAALLLAEAFPERARPVHIHIDKCIPVAGGMAGGSADAAGALVACDLLWGLGLGVNGLHEYAARLGSDVNFALIGGTALGTGRGEKVTPVLTRGTYHWVIVAHDDGLSTPLVFRHLDELRGSREVPAPQASSALINALAAGDVAGVAAGAHNDLQAPALSLRPDLAAILHAGLELGALAGFVSGSGPTLVFLVEDDRSGRDLAAALVSGGAARRTHTATGPVPGAQALNV